MPAPQGKDTPQSTIIGTVLMLIGVAPPVLWIGHVTDLLPLTTDISVFILFGWPLFFCGFGLVLIRHQGETVGAVWKSFVTKLLERIVGGP